MKKLRLAYLTTNPSDVFPLISAAKALLEEDVVEVCLRTGEDFVESGKFEEFVEFARRAHLLIVHLHGGKRSFPEFDRLMSLLEGSDVPIHAQATATEHDVELVGISTVGEEDYRRISRYLNYGGEENFRNLILFAANKFAGASTEFEEPKRPPWDGIYHPDFDHIPSLEEYLQKKVVPGRPTVGLWFYQSFWLSKNVTFVDGLIREIERQEANVIPVFLYSVKDEELGTKGPELVIEEYFVKEGKVLIDVLVSTLMFSLSMKVYRTSEGTEAVPEEGKFLRKLGVPVIKAILTYNSQKEWRGSVQGLNPLDVAMSVAMPEFDGMLITFPVAARKLSEEDPITGTRITRFEPIPERVEKCVRLALKWARLRHIPNGEKKVAIILHNYPPRNDRIGTAFGLDSPASVWKILAKLREQGYKLDHLPEDGQALMEEVLEGATNDRRWLSTKELSKRAVGKVSAEQYWRWFGELPEEVRERMIKAWGRPPGELLIPGLLNGNVFVGVQPPRGFLDAPSAIYHSPDHPIPHHYYAYYRWIRDVFRADVVMHIGKHGSLEWLPGKSVGLSNLCFPDIAISDLPNIYPYIVNDPGEGIQAKRRSYCCIIDHLIPVMHNADSYGELAEIEVLSKDYRQALTEDPGKVPELRRMIWQKVKEAKLDHDLEVDEDTALSNFDRFLEKLRDYIYEISDTQIRDGLHILGEPPREERLDEFLVSLTRLPNGKVPSLRESLARLRGFDYEELLSNRGRIVTEGKTGGEVLRELDELSLRLVRRLREEGFDRSKVRSVTEEVLGGSDHEVEEVLGYMASFLAPSVEATKGELENAISALEGGFVPPGPSGSPTHGMADILPTGRNFYSVDPQAIPSSSAWRMGTALGDALLERYLKDEGRYPENVGMVIWGTPTMRTKGDDIAEVLYLLGVKPVWEEASGRVKGLEVIPLEKLKRPRIDVTVRISGLLRDAFPNVVELLDEAVHLVADLDEPSDMNFVAKHIREEMEEKVTRGMDPERAKEEASYRIFGCRPGTYGAGVSEVIDSKNWRDEKDLGEIYVVWGGYAYGKGKFGIEAKEEFKRRLSRLDLTVKNEDTREYDMLDSDDFYSYHGGMIAAVKAFKGELPRSYSGDSSDPDRVKVRSTVEETKHIFRARILNPKWIESMKRHGYKGAGDLSRAVDIAFGWDATAEVLEDWMYEELAKEYALDEEMQNWLKEVNPYALQNIAERLLEAIERGMWQASEEMEEELKKVYLEIEGALEESTG